MSDPARPRGSRSHAALRVRGAAPGRRVPAVPKFARAVYALVQEVLARAAGP